MQGGGYAVASGGVLQHHNMAGLLAAESETAGLHGLQHVTISDLCLLDRNSNASHRIDQSQVAHHRGNDRVVLQSTLLAERKRQDGQDLITVNDPAECVHRQAAVGIAIERDPEIGMLFQHCFSQRVHVSRPAVLIDVDAVWLSMDSVYLGSLGL